MRGQGWFDQRKRRVFSKSTFPFELMFGDDWGPFPELSTNGSRFYLSIVDEFIKFIWFFPLQAKSDVLKFCIAFLQFVNYFFSTKVRAVQRIGEENFVPSKKYYNQVVLFTGSLALTPTIKTRVLNGVIDTFLRQASHF